MEDVRGSETALPHYYHILNCGFRPGLAAGTDYPCDSPPLPLGNLLTYVNVPDGKLTYRKWIDGIAGGHTVISRNGHDEFLDFKVNGETGPGDEVALAKPGKCACRSLGPRSSRKAGGSSWCGMGRLFRYASESQTRRPPIANSESLEFRESGWVCARRMDAKGHVLHTAAVFVKVGGAPCGRAPKMRSSTCTSSSACSRRPARAANGAVISTTKATRPAHATRRLSTCSRNSRRRAAPGDQQTLRNSLVSALP